MNAQRTPLLPLFPGRVEKRLVLWYAEARQWDGSLVTLDIAYRGVAHQLMLVAPHREQGNLPNMTFRVIDTTWAAPPPGKEFATHVCVSLVADNVDPGQYRARAVYIGAWKVLDDNGNVLSGTVLPATDILRYQDGVFDYYPDYERTITLLGARYDEWRHTLHVARSIYDAYYPSCDDYGWCTEQYEYVVMYHTHPGYDSALVQRTWSVACRWGLNCSPSQVTFPDARVHRQIPLDSEGRGYIHIAEITQQTNPPYDVTDTVGYVVRSDGWGFSFAEPDHCSNSTCENAISVSSDGDDILLTEGIQGYVPWEQQTYEDLMIHVYQYRSGAFTDLSNTVTELASESDPRGYILQMRPITHEDWRAILSKERYDPVHTVVRLRTGLRNRELEQLVREANTAVPIGVDDLGNPRPGSWQIARR